MSNPLIRRILHALQQDESFWPSYEGAMDDARGMDTDFPGEGDGPVRRLHEANAKLSERAMELEPDLLGDWRLRYELILTAEQVALEQR